MDHELPPAWGQAHLSSGFSQTLGENDRFDLASLDNVRDGDHA